MEKLIRDGDARPSGSSPAIAHSLPDLPRDTRVYTGYTLLSVTSDIVFEHDSAVIGVGAYHEIKASYPRSQTVPWSSSDESVALVSKDGVVLGIHAGTAVITGAIGDKTAVCTITVCDYIDFSGDIYELKTLIEESVDVPLFIRLQDTINTKDPNVFPITIAPKQTVHIDYNANQIRYSVEYPPTDLGAMFYNYGGNLYFENLPGKFNTFSTLMYFGGSDNGKTGNLVLNTHGALFSADNMSLMLFVSNQTSSSDAAVANTDNSTVIINNCEVTSNESDTLYNDTTSKATLTDSICHGTINSSGTIDVISGGAFDLIKNTGIINKIVNVSFSNNPISHDIYLETCGASAAVYEIRNCEFKREVTINADDNSGEVFPVMMFADGATLGRIVGGTYAGSGADITVDDTVMILSGISGGTFSHEIPQKLLTSGYVCMQNDDGYVVARAA